MARLFRVSGGLAAAVLVGVPPTVLRSAAMVARNLAEQGLTGGLLLGLALVAAGPAMFFLMRRQRIS